MSVLAENVELIREVANLLIHFLERRVHVAVHISGRGVFVWLVVNEASWVSGVDPVVHVDVVLAIIALVAKRPDDDRDMVPEAVDKLFGSVDVCIGPLSIQTVSK